MSTLKLAPTSLLADTIWGYATLLSGAYDDVPEEQIAYQGSLTPHP